jgi:tRNA(fMet)-specific endonuclease VapC
VAAVLIDTSVLVDAERGGEALQRVPVDEERAISVVTVSELLHGVHRAVSDPVRVRRQAAVEEVLATMEPIPITKPVARVHADIWAGLEAAGEIVDAHDLWIAATALVHGMQVATTNARHFQRVPGLSVLAVS